ncbi:GNAT family N-acetyltransferase [Arthrobacter livingstonensis]|nr:GNAT family N-acetyltransferase [Arthrobacter livingstonensis]
MNAPVVLSPVPREKWRSMLASDPASLPDQAPEWVDAMVEDGPFSDASRLYSFADGREALLPLVRRQGVAGLGGWLQSFPPGWGIGGLLGAETDKGMVQSILSDLRGLHLQRVAIRPDPQRWAAWAQALDQDAVDGGELGGSLLVIPRRAHVIDLSNGVDAAWMALSKSARRGVRAAKREGVRIETGHSGALLEAYYSLFMTSIDRWAANQHEPRALAHARARRRDPLAKLQSMGRHLGEDFTVTLAYVDGKPAIGTITLFGATAHDTRSAMDKALVGGTGAGELVQWTTLRLACAKGCAAYHLGESGQSLALAKFKEKFGALPRDYAELRLDRLPWSRADAAARGVVKRVLGFRDV